MMDKYTEKKVYKDQAKMTSIVAGYDHKNDKEEIKRNKLRRT